MFMFNGIHRLSYAFFSVNVYCYCAGIGFCIRCLRTILLASHHRRSQCVGLLVYERLAIDKQFERWTYRGRPRG